MAGFTKLFSEILSSSIWNEDDKTRLVWITMLAAADANGVVRASVGGLAYQARVNREDCLHSIEKLSGPDEDSRSREFDGARIAPVDGGWVILNYTKYRERITRCERTTYMRDYMREYRKQRVNKSTKRKQNVSTVSPEAEAEAEAEAYTSTHTTPPASQTAAPRRRVCAAKASEEECREYAASRGFPKADGSAFFDSMEANGWKTRVGPVKDWQAAFRTREKNGWLSSQQNGGRTPQKPQKPLTDRPAPPRPEIPPEDLISQDDVRGLLANLSSKIATHA